MSHKANLERISLVAKKLESIQEKVVFVGGATISFYPNRQVFEVRPTYDVDLIVEIITYAERAEFEYKLREIGFTHDVASGLACRFRINEIVVDIMPTDDPSIGFKNQWYPEGFRNSIDYKIGDDQVVQILSTPYFIATKIEAFKGRGEMDGRTSHDFEDIIYVLENRDGIWDELDNAHLELKKYLQNEFKLLLSHPHVFEWIDSHVERGSPPATYTIMDEIAKFIG